MWRDGDRSRDPHRYCVRVPACCCGFSVTVTDMGVAVAVAVAAAVDFRLWVVGRGPWRSGLSATRRHPPSGPPAAARQQ